MAAKLALYRWRGVMWQFEEGKQPAGAVRVAVTEPETPESRQQPKKLMRRRTTKKQES